MSKKQERIAKQNKAATRSLLMILGGMLLLSFAILGFAFSMQAPVPTSSPVSGFVETETIFFTEGRSLISRYVGDMGIVQSVTTAQIVVGNTLTPLVQGMTGSWFANGIEYTYEVISVDTEIDPMNVIPNQPAIPATGTIVISWSN